MQSRAGPLCSELHNDEAIARYGPLVMNMETETYQAIEDYRRGQWARLNLE
jgi:redox-sensitive bicupin YhaK (pirin superfamily)